MAYTPPVGSVSLSLGGAYAPPTGSVTLSLGAEAGNTNVLYGAASLTGGYALSQFRSEELPPAGASISGVAVLSVAVPSSPLSSVAALSGTASISVSRDGGALSAAGSFDFGLNIGNVYAVWDLPAASGALSAACVVSIQRPGLLTASTTYSAVQYIDVLVTSASFDALASILASFKTSVRVKATRTWVQADGSVSATVQVSVDQLADTLSALGVLSGLSVVGVAIDGELLPAATLVQAGTYIAAARPGLLSGTGALSASADTWMNELLTGVLTARGSLSGSCSLTLQFRPTGGNLSVGNATVQLSLISVSEDPNVWH